MSLVEKPKGKPMNPLDYGPTLPSGQHEHYPILPAAERIALARPVRREYRHIGVRPSYPVRDLTPEEEARYKAAGYVKYEQYPADESPVTGRYWTQKQLQSGCGTITIMGQALAETYAADPTYYGATFCVQCHGHFPVQEFVWTADGSVVGS